MAVLNFDNLRYGVERYAEQLHERAVDVVLANLDRRVPSGADHRSSGGPPLKDTRIVRDESSSQTLKASIEYPTDVATWTDEGTEPHPIDGNPLLVFEWPKVGPGLFFFRHVDHPGSHKNDGWFSDEVDEDSWDRALYLVEPGTTVMA